MKVIEKFNKSRVYFTPKIVKVKLDNEISLALESPPPGPDETMNSMKDLQNSFNNNSFC